MTPIERALAKVRELRGAERKMTAEPWRRESTIINGKDYGCTGVETLHEDGYELCPGSFTQTIAQVPHGLRVDGQVSNNMAGIAVLRNAAPALLDLLEALLPLRQAVADYHKHVTDCCCEQCEEYGMICNKINGALAAFVEGTDGK